MDRATDAVVIGGGLTGLATAALLGRRGLAVTIVEKAEQPGGRAATTEKSGFSLNLGAHALYRGGPAERVLRELGVATPGKSPPTSGGLAVQGGALHALPMGFTSFLTTGLMGLSSKLALVRLFARITLANPAELQGISVAAWLEKASASPGARQVGEAFLRLSTYTADAERLSAGAAIAQFQRVLRHNVIYVDGGWRTLIDGLRDAAVRAGASLRTGSKATGVAIEGGAVTAVELADGSRIAAKHAIIAASPHAASALAPGVPILREHAERSIPVKVACLDVGLSALPRKRAIFALGIDRPLYLSVHSAVARVAPEGGAMIHAVHYAPSGDPGKDEEELEGLFDLVQPGWRERLVEKRFLPSMVVSNAMVTAASGGFAGRPGVAVPGVAGLLLSGDWIGPEGMLADTGLGSAKLAADQVMAERA